MPEQRVTISTHDHIATVSLTRPAKKNALDLAMFEALAAAAARLADDPTVRVVVLRGEGGAFSAGLDLAAFMGDPATIQALLEKAPGEFVNLAQRVAWAWRELPVPVIAALHGEVFGGGFQIALGADIRIVAPDTRLSIMEVYWGLVPDMAGSRILKDLVGYDVAMELTLTGRIIGGDEAHGLGLVTRVTDDPHAEASAMAAVIARRSPDAVRAIKCLLHNAPRLDDREGLNLETRLQMSLLGGKNQMEAARARLEGREPAFRPATACAPE
jgi:enoyl-CoA hydratase/carnithine racemase